MKTEAMLAKHKKVLAGILKCEPSNIIFQVERQRGGKPEWVEIGAVEWKKKDQEFLYQWSLGSYRVVLRGSILSTFKLYQMPHCCGIIVSCEAKVEQKFRKIGIGTALNVLRQDIGRALGFSLMLCTDIEQNEPQRRLLKTNGWSDLTNFVNKRTNNRVYVCAVNL